MAPPYQAPVVTKAFDILRAVSRSETGLRISDIASLLGIGKSTVHGITAALTAQGALVRDPSSRRFTIGLTLMELGKAAYRRVDIKQAARPEMETLMAGCRESVFLGIRNGLHVTVIDLVESSKDFKISSPIGTSLPLLAGALGKIFLAAMPPARAAAFLKTHALVPYTPNSIVDPETYLDSLDQVRSQGVALDDEEYLSGVRAVAVRLTETGGYQPALWVVGFTAGMPDSQMPGIIQQTLLTAKRIDARLSQRPSAAGRHESFGKNDHGH